MTQPDRYDDARSTAHLARPRLDVHTHFFPAALPDVAARTGDPRWPSLVVDPDGTGRIVRGSSTFRVVAPTCWDIARRRSAMDQSEMDVQVLSPVPVTLVDWAEPDLAAEFCRRQNDLLAEAASTAPGRFAAMGCVPLQDADAAVEEMARIVDELSMVGVEIGTTVGGRELDDETMRPVFAAAEELDLAVFVHPTDGAGAIRRGGVPYEFGLGMLTDTAMAAGALVFGGVLERFPRLRVGLAHGCGTFAWALPRMQRGGSLAPGGRSAESVAELTRRLWVDSLVFDPHHLPLLFDRFGADHIVLGSDFPFYPPSFGSPTAVLDDAVTLGLCTAAQRGAIVDENGRQFLGAHAPGALDPRSPIRRADRKEALRDG